MKNNDSSRKTKFLALLLSVLMCSSVTALAACNADDSSSSSTSSSSSSSSSAEEEKTDAEKNYLVQNPNFAKVADANMKYFSTTVDSWTRAAYSASTGTAQASQSASGIIDTSDAAWTSMTTNAVENVKNLTEAQAKDRWSTMTLKDKLAYYEAWEDANEDDDKKLTGLSFYESVTIDEEDLPDCANPKTHHTDTSADGYDSKVLMIHNDYDTTNYHKQGTAQKYTSSSTVTVAAGTAARLSLWVKTADLRSASSDNAENGQEAVDKGAYIRLSHTVGGKTLEPLEVKNINTDGYTDHNGWKQYTFYIQGSSFASTTLTLELGLGQSGGTNMNEYVNGYAFFDDIECKTITLDEYSADTTSLTEYTLAHTAAGSKTVNAYRESDVNFAMNLSGSAFADNDYLNGAFTYEYTTQKNTTDGVFTAVKNGATGIANPANAKKPVALGTLIDGSNDVATVYADAAALASTTNRYLKAVYENYLQDNALIESKSFSLLFSSEGAPLTAKNDATFSVNEGDYLAISFYVKTSAMNGTAGATVTLKDASGKTISALESIDTTTVDTNEATDGWQRCFFFVEAKKAETLSVTLQLGPTTLIGTTQDAYKPGYAAFTNFTTHAFANDDEFALATDGTYAKKVTVSDEEIDPSGKFDDVAAISDIETNYGTPKNYTLYKGGDKPAPTTENATAGLLNQKYKEEYKTAGLLTQLGATGTTAEEQWNSVFSNGLLGTANQPLVLFNGSYATASYGFVGKSQTIPTDSYQSIAMRLKVSAGAKAYVYLIDTDDDSFNNSLSVSRNVTYWYDDDGNVCASDPSASGFRDKDIALFRQSNGLYKVNPSWWKTLGTTESVPNGYYANLQAFGTPDANDNLRLADGFTAYDYMDKWQHEGNNGIAFYGYNAENMTAYSDQGKKTQVTDFSKLTGLTARYEAHEAKKLCVEINGDGSWKDVKFFLKTGATAKNYRLEIWCGNRNDATANGTATTAYVIADSYDIGTLDADTYKNNLAEREDETANADSFKSTFTFFDTAKFLRYNKELDLQGVGNSYDEYKQSNYEEDVVYLYYQDDATYETYANFSLADTSVDTDAVDDDTTEDDTDSTTTSELNPWLLASSIIVAAVLLLAIISLVVRKALVRTRKNRRVAPTQSNKNDK